MKKNKALFACMALCAAFLVAPGQVVYTDLQPDITSSGTYNLDMDQDGRTDFVFKHTTATASGKGQCQGQQGTNQFIKVTAANSNKIADSTVYSDVNPARLPTNTTIDNNLKWSGKNNRLIAAFEYDCLLFWGYYYWGTISSGQWAYQVYNNADGILGVSLGGNGKTRYGWIRLSIAPDGSSFTIKNYAYNDADKAAILAGQASDDYAGILPMPGNFCAGQQVPVSYILAGNFGASNTVKAQLSDATGSFANPADIGQVTSSASGTIQAIIPALTAQGSYRFRIVTTQPVFVSEPTEVNSPVTGGLPDGIITSSANTNICETASSVYLNSTFSACVSYQWKLNGVDIPGANNNYFNPVAPGDYSCSKANAAGTVVSNIITITANLLPAEILFCCGSPPAFSCGNPINLYTGSYGYTFQWQLNGADIPGATAYNYNAEVSGDYTCIKTNGCGSITSNTIPVTIYPPMANAIISASGDLLVCSGPVGLEANQEAQTTYQWYRSNSAISGAVNSSYDADVSGYYRVIETNANGCTRQSNTIQVTIGPPVAATYASYGTEVCHNHDVPITAYPTGEGYSVQWLKDGLDINAETLATIWVKDPGTYAARISVVSGGCSSTSPDVVITENCANQRIAIHDEPGSVVMSVMPNPASAFVTISFSVDAEAPVDISLLDLSGRLVLGNATSLRGEGRHQVDLDISSVAPGCYLLKVKAGNESVTKRIIVSR